MTLIKLADKCDICGTVHIGNVQLNNDKTYCINCLIKKLFKDFKDKLETTLKKMKEMRDYHYTLENINECKSIILGYEDLIKDLIKSIDNIKVQDA